MIELQLDDVLYNIGILGLCRVLDSADLPSDKKNGQTITFAESNLNNFEEHYFSALVDLYGSETSYYKMVNTNSKQFVKKCIEGITEEKELERFNTLIDNMKRWLTSNSYKNVYPFLTEIPYDFEASAKAFKKVNKKKKETVADVQLQVTEMARELLECLSFLEHKQAKRYIVPRILSYTVIRGFWSNVSLLNSNASKKDLYVEYKNYFIQAAENYLETKKDQKKYAKNKLTCACCDNKMKSATEAFDLTWVQKVGVDAARKSSHYWDHQRDIFICPICNIVYSCIPLGFTLVRGAGLFINNNRSVEDLVSVNSISLKAGKVDVSRDDLESMAYYQLLDLMGQQAENQKLLEIDNIQIVKYDRNSESRPYTFNMLSREKAQQMYDSRKDFQFLVGKFAKENGEYLSLYQEVLRRFYNGLGFADLLYRLMRLVIDDEFKGMASIYKVLNISNNRFKGRSHYMTQEELRKIRISGYYLKQAYRGQEAKLNAISYRLLNALKVKNPNKFMDTIFQAYSYKKNEKLAIPTFFIQALNDIEKFQTIGYAFLIGLNGYEKSEDEKEDTTNE
ncbi:type I-B CRISPR-associated protein Cas8b1/Cst1 [Lysinibacillus fusiformis]|uniref:type I-B CRISPR-associated protein Cas8b1/Cst1 n=1 Tax=Lysinibacillus fusiformis TaxID=28031 RepID=UPI00087E2F7C|nr:type I-B CRISPR-associated protein Cas8b1/Cst1 [Lysinibacillus fusiformis]SCX63480.1 CRISPR-associated protein Cst1 [Lysinibacillus fusiformis]SDB46329.1 CRISPR-associated protein Cst1 [Lysinibacillus fusiformis]SFI73354.1 CRISPR-associated protein Cst1 [Lysinibacillus fusiformis]SFT15890.1 CRISPR-associated protein Cst1 [Lysinibacillus fusiformis]